MSFPDSWLFASGGQSIGALGSSDYQYLSLKQAGKESTCNVGDLGLIPGLERSPGEGKGNQLQDSGQENSMNCIVHGVTKSRTQLSNFHLKQVVTPNYNSWPEEAAGQ